MKQKIGRILSDFNFPNFVGVELDRIHMLIYRIGFEVRSSLYWVRLLFNFTPVNVQLSECTPSADRA